MRRCTDGQKGRRGRNRRVEGMCKSGETENDKETREERQDKEYEFEKSRFFMTTVQLFDCLTDEKDNAH